MQPRRPSFGRSAPRDTSASRAFFALAIIAILIFGVDIVSNGMVRSSVREVGGFTSAAVASVAQVLPNTERFATRASLVAKNKQLQDMLSARAEEDARFEAVRAENETLRELARLVEDEDGGVSAAVISSFTTSPYGTFVIGAGERHGVREGATVLTAGGFVLGSVVATQDRTATVEALFAPEKEIEATIGDVPLLLYGKGGGNARGEAPRDAALRVGDVVTIPSFGGRSAGIVVELESASSSAATTLFIRVPTNLDTLRFVYVI